MPTVEPTDHRGDTVAAVPRPPNLRPLSHDQGEIPNGERVLDAQFKIRLADTEGRHRRTSRLIMRRSAWRGYEVSTLSGNLANVITLAAFNQDKPVVTMTVGVGSPSGLVVEVLYPDEVRALRATGLRLCEFTKLAVNNMVRSKPYSRQFSTLPTSTHIEFRVARTMD